MGGEGDTASPVIPHSSRSHVYVYPNHVVAAASGTKNTTEAPKDSKTKLDKSIKEARETAKKLREKTKDSGGKQVANLDYGMCGPTFPFQRGRFCMKSEKSVNQYDKAMPWANGRIFVWREATGERTVVLGGG